MADPAVGMQAFEAPATSKGQVYRENFHRRTVHLSDEVWEEVARFVAGDEERSKAATVETALREYLGLAPLDWEFTHNKPTSGR